jgi:hypothetical protein
MERELFTSLVTAVYGDQSGHFAEGTWGVEASDIVRRNPSLLQKYLITRSLSDKVGAATPPALASQPQHALPPCVLWRC